MPKLTIGDFRKLARIHRNMLPALERMIDERTKDADYMNKLQATDDVIYESVADLCEARQKTHHWSTEVTRWVGDWLALLYFEKHPEVEMLDTELYGTGEEDAEIDD